jgi:hypothetical protein
MTKLLFLYSLIFLSVAARADYLFTVGAESRLEQGMDQNVDFTPYFDVAFAYKFQKPYTVGIEYFQSPSQLTGQSSLNIARTRQGTWATSSWESGTWGFLSPYLRGGLGGYWDTVTTSLMGMNSTDVSRLYLCGFGGVGLRLNTLKEVFLAIEGRFIFGENENPQPAPSALFRLGFAF